MRSSRGRHLMLAIFGLGAWLALYGLAAAPAWAHFGAVQGGGWSDGFAHPFSGIDHFVAMVAIGLWTAQLGGRSLWLLPSVFTLLMVAGAVLGFAGVALPGAEDGIALSLAVPGVLLAVAARPRLTWGAALVGVFGLVHGYAHGTEMPESVTPALYALGFLCATVVLQAFGVVLGTAATSRAGQKLLPLGAAAIAGIGVSLLLSL
jgi:urease accessory protein